MRILCVADKENPDLMTSEGVKAVGPIDFIISCGDLRPEYLANLCNRYDSTLYYVKGNHDLRYEQAPPMGCMDIHRKIVTHGDLKLMGLEGCRWYNGGPQQYSELEMQQMLNWMRPKIWWGKGVDIVVTHAAPLHIHDAEDRCHRGFSAFRKLIRLHKPRYLLHGHIHTNFTEDEERITVENETTVINCFDYYVLEVNG